MSERHIRSDSEGRLWERAGPWDGLVHPELGGSEVFWREVDSVPLDLAQQLYEALKETGGTAAEMIRSELHLKPGEEAPPVAARTEAALARFKREVVGE